MLWPSVAVAFWSTRLSRVDDIVQCKSLLAKGFTTYWTNTASPCISYCSPISVYQLPRAATIHHLTCNASRGAKNDGQSALRQPETGPSGHSGTATTSLQVWSLPDEQRDAKQDNGYAKASFCPIAVPFLCSATLCAIWLQQLTAQLCHVCTRNHVC